MKNVFGKIAVLAVFGMAAGVCAEEVQFSDVPKAVQKTINQNLNGGVVKKIDKEAENGKTVYEVGVRRDGKDKEVRIDADGKLLPSDDLSANSSININTDKNDGKILGIVPMEGNDDGVNAEAKIGDKKLKMEADVDRTHDVEVNGHREFNARTDIDLDHNDSKVTVETDSGKHKIFHKGDGKLLGFIPWKKPENKVEVNVETDANVGSPAESASGSGSKK